MIQENNLAGIGRFLFAFNFHFNTDGGFGDAP